MASVTTRKPINLPALIEAVGVDLTITADGGLAVIIGDVDQQALNDAIAAHDADPQPKPVDLQAQIDGLTDYILSL